MNKENFKVGDLLTFTPTNHRGYSAEAGAIARVDALGQDTVEITWLDSNSKGQSNGNYRYDNFKKVNMPQEQPVLVASKISCGDILYYKEEKDYHDIMYLGTKVKVLERRGEFLDLVILEGPRKDEKHEGIFYFRFSRVNPLTGCETSLEGKNKELLKNILSKIKKYPELLEELSYRANLYESRKEEGLC